jgi:hypothetical protein
MTINAKMMAETIEAKLMADKQTNNRRNVMRDELSANAT